MSKDLNGEMGSVPQVLVWKENHLHMFSNGKKAPLLVGRCPVMKPRYLSEWDYCIFHRAPLIGWFTGETRSIAEQWTSHQIQFKQPKAARKMVLWFQKDIFPKIFLSTTSCCFQPSQTWSWNHHGSPRFKAVAKLAGHWTATDCMTARILGISMSIVAGWFDLISFRLLWFALISFGW